MNKARRHAGRSIRKQRRQFTRVTAGFRQLSEAFATAAREVFPEVIRSMSRFSTQVLTRQHMFSAVRNLRDIPVDGDTLAHYQERATKEET